MKRKAPAVWAIAALAISLTLSGCTADADPVSITPSPSASVADPNDVPPDTTDYSKDAGSDPVKYVYEKEEPPAESVVATLCNLTQTYFTGLRTAKDGVAVADDNLRTNLVGLSDLLDYWETLRPQYPSSAADIDAGIAIYGDWDSALLSQENDDAAAAKKSMAAAEALILQLPVDTAAQCQQ